MSANPAQTNPESEANLFPRPITEEEIRALDALVGDSVPPLIAQGRETFLRDLPQLLKTHYGWSAAYSGNRRLGLSRSAWKLYDECLRRGLKPSEVLVVYVDASHFYPDIELGGPELDQ